MTIQAPWVLGPPEVNIRIGANPVEIPIYDVADKIVAAVRCADWPSAHAVPDHARLIAAAPDLLAALRDVMAHLIEARDHGLTSRSRDDMISITRAAIAKAEGR